MFNIVGSKTVRAIITLAIAFGIVAPSSAHMKRVARPIRAYQVDMSGAVAESALNVTVDSDGDLFIERDGAADTMVAAISMGQRSELKEILEQALTWSQYTAQAGLDTTQRVATFEVAEGMSLTLTFTSTDQGRDAGLLLDIEYGHNTAELLLLPQSIEELIDTVAVAG